MAQLTRAGRRRTGVFAPLSLLLAAALLAGGAQAAPEPAAADAAVVHEYALDNGMKLLVKEDHRAPVVVSQVWYKVGSSYEHDGITGVSHALEHMMFKGTRKHPGGEFSRIVSENGGRENAFTGRDYTTYFQQLEKSRLAISFELEADRMRNLTLPADEFAKELRVVQEERRLRTEDNPEALTYEQFTAAAFVSSPYHHPIIGWMNDLDAMQVDDLRAWYRTWYAPNNATLVVAGDVDPDAVYTLARKYFGALKPSRIPAQKPRLEIAQNGERRIVVKAPAQLPYVVMGYKVPVLRTAENDSEVYALEVLAGILDGGDSARISARLIRDRRIAASAGADYNPYARLGDLFVLDGTPAQGHDVAELEQALRGEVQRLRDEPVTAEELDRIKTQVIAADVYQRDSVFYQAMRLGTLETVGLDWRLADAYVERVRAVTAEQVQAAARKYLSPDRLTVAVLDPLPIDPSRPAPAMGASGHDLR
ncbi:MAG: insulinase family protein [Gammaproteobacteria bacterium]|nr:insulinase family protein [Gammaproteobacteria bacterium]